MNAADIKLFIAHLLVMFSMKKPALHSYWSATSPSRTPFFRQYLSRNKFQDILWNLHVCDTSSNPPRLPNHDPLAKVRPFIQMCQDNFLLRYTPNEYISLDESCVPFKGRVWFLQYSKAKPNKFHINMFTVSEYELGYICGFSIYTGKSSNKLVEQNCTLDPDCTKTTKTVMGLLQNTKLLDKHRSFFL